MIIPDIIYSNHLINENSSYLLQHAHNPVNWYPWGDEAFKKAKDENKLVLVSIGYAACHWCHVMEHESFEDEGVAAIMNEHFVCIKVDREERPDIDQIYMDAVQLLSRRGGWPLNCFALPDGRPVFGGTYFPKESWKEVLLTLNRLYTENYEKIQEQASAITSALSDISSLLRNNPEETFNIKYLEEYYSELSKTFDLKLGGSKGAPKFPMPVVYEFLLRYSFHSDNKNALGHVLLTLDQMALGGIYDHIGGGFARYSTDEHWFAPHFEKMLYDNAQLVSLYSKAYKVSRKPEYKNVIIETLNFIERELTSDDGAFYSSLDADSEGEEGKYYVWTKNEIDNILRPDSALFCRYYQVTAEGNWEEGKNILHLKSFPESSETLVFLNQCKSRLLKERSSRVWPALDSKILCSWNALMLEAYLEAYTALGEVSYFEKALTNAAYLEQYHIQKGGKVFRVNQNGKTIHGFLDDYAFTAHALVKLFRISCNEKWLGLAREITDNAIRNFFDSRTGLFFYTSNEDPPLSVRKHELHDNVIPASNSMMANVLHLMSRYFEEESYHDKAWFMLRSLSDTILQHAWHHAGWANLLCDIIYPNYEIAIAGPDAREKVMELESLYLPHLLICGSSEESFLPLLDQRFKAGETWLYVCENRTCKLPVTKVEVVLNNIPARHIY